MDSNKKKELNLWAARIRRTALQTIQTAGSGHIGGSFSLGEILSVLYFDIMDIDPKNPKKEDRDRLVLSKGHCSPALYATLALRGFFPVEHLSTFRKIDSDLSGHVEIHVPGVDMSAGSLGQGLSVALGMAMYSRAAGTGNRAFCILGDGEIQEGQVWEAAMCAGFYKADNLIAFVDNNKLQLDGSLEEIMSPYPIGDKFRAFGWNVLEVDGHDVEQIENAVKLASSMKGKPTMIVADTVKGKGVSLFENDVNFHGGQPKADQWAGCFAELDARIAELEE
ncbi:MAG: transketolase [Eubacteriales bacterium]|nr:transketolase [Eubacteriales bacterium]